MDKTSKYLLAGSFLAYGCALLLPVVEGPVRGWECLWEGWSIQPYWLPNPMLFLAWLTIRKSWKLSATLSSFALGFAAYTLLVLSLETVRLGGALWFCSIALALGSAIACSSRQTARRPA